jgi:hypothetical protein
MANDRVDLEIARLIGQPIDPNLKVPAAIAEICNVETAAPGEIVKTFEASDANADDIYAIGDSTLVKHVVDPVTPATLSFVGLKSKLEYVLVDTVLGLEDQGALARKKASLTRAMDKEELRRIIAGILLVAASEVTTVVADEIYENFLKMIQQVEDYGDNYVLLVSPDVQAKIDSYEIDNAVAVRSYEVSLRQMLKDAGVTVIKIVGKVNGANLITAKTAILIARDSTLAAGKPIYFIRRSINPAIAAQMGIEGGERLVSVAQVPTIVNADGLNYLGYGCFGYESISLSITNYRAIAWSDAILS